jgi:hypothetical protein
MRSHIARIVYLSLAGVLVFSLSAFRPASATVPATAQMTSCASGLCTGICSCADEPLLSCNSQMGKKCVCPGEN